MNNGKKNEKKRLIPEERGGKSVPSFSEAVSGQMNAMMPSKAYLRHHRGAGDIVDTSKLVSKPLH